MRIHIIENGVVANTIEAESLEHAQALLPDALLADAETAGTIGDAYDEESGTFSSYVKPFDLEASKAKLNEDINEWRLNKNHSTFPHAGKTIACDALSRSDIDAVANSISLTGAFPAGFPNAWKATDNTYIMLPTIEDFKAMHASMTAQGTANFNQSQQFKTSMSAATTEEDINAVYAAMKAA